MSPTRLTDPPEGLECAGALSAASYGARVDHRTSVRSLQAFSPDLAPGTVVLSDARQVGISEDPGDSGLKVVFDDRADLGSYGFVALDLT